MDLYYGNEKQKENKNPIYVPSFVYFCWRWSTVTKWDLNTIFFSSHIFASSWVMYAFYLESSRIEFLIIDQIQYYLKKSKLGQVIPHSSLLLTCQMLMWFIICRTPSPTFKRSWIVPPTAGKVQNMSTCRRNISPVPFKVTENRSWFHLDMVSSIFIFFFILGVHQRYPLPETTLSVNISGRWCGRC